MAARRKPLIEPGSCLPPVRDETPADDLIGRIVERDRERSGRKPRPTPEAAPAEAEENITGNITAQLSAQAESKEAAQLSAQADAPRRSKAEAQGRGKKEWHRIARNLGGTRMIPITLRIPEGLNDWLDDWAHEHRKQGVKKQDLVARAVQLLMIALESGEDLDL